MSENFLPWLAAAFRNASAWNRQDVGFRDIFGSEQEIVVVREREEERETGRGREGGREREPQLATAVRNASARERKTFSERESFSRWLSESGEMEKERESFSERESGGGEEARMRGWEPAPRGWPSGIHPHRECAGPLPLIRGGADLQS
jgi:hypothetical protein